MSFLITGASGFVGCALLGQLHDKGLAFKAAFRNSPDSSEKNQAIAVGAIDGTTDWSAALLGIDGVVHCAARAHIMSDEAANPLIEYRKVNTEGTLNLARQAAAAGVKRFIFISSIKVNGEGTSVGNAFTESSGSSIQDPYGISKKEAEEGLRAISSETGMEVVIIRPPLVYGAGVKANFLNLMKLADSGIPLPFAAIGNQRSMVYVENLVDFIIHCIDHPDAANQTFLISDGEDLSLSSLLGMIRDAMGRSKRLFPVPVTLFWLLGRLTGKSAVVGRLVGNLQVDSAKARALLNWAPPFTVQQGIQATVSAYLNSKKVEGSK